MFAVGKLCNESPEEVAIVGLNAAGKTSILYRMTHDTDVTTIHTIGFNVENFSVGNTSFNVWDIGGQDDIRALWKGYLDIAAGIVFVVDIDDQTRWAEAGREIDKILNDDVNGRKPIMILANKADDPQDPELQHKINELKRALPLDPSKHVFAVFHVAAVVSKTSQNPLERLYPAFSWIGKVLKEGTKVEKNRMYA